MNQSMSSTGEREYKTLQPTPISTSLDGHVLTEPIDGNKLLLLLFYCTALVRVHKCQGLRRGWQA